MGIGYNNQAKSSNEFIQNYKFIIAGGVSGAVTRCLFQPLDVLKIRFQLQVESFDKTNGGKYKGLLQAVRTIVTEEGLSALWKGHVPAQSLSIVYGCVQFLAFEKASKQLSLKLPSWKQMPISDFTCGVVSTTSATIISFPFDVVRTRLVAQGSSHKVYTGTASAFLQILTKEKLSTLFRGLTPTLLQVAPQGGIQFTVYNALSHLLFYSSHFSYFDDNSHQHLTAIGSLISGSLSGLTAKVSIYPLDLAKKRIQIQGFDRSRSQFGETLQCKSLVDCLFKTYKKESIFGLYKGLVPSLLKAAVTTGAHFTVYEQTLRLIS